MISIVGLFCAVFAVYLIRLYNRPKFDFTVIAAYDAMQRFVNQLRYEKDPVLVGWGPDGNPKEMSTVKGVQIVVVDSKGDVFVEGNKGMMSFPSVLPRGFVRYLEEHPDAPHRYMVVKDVLLMVITVNADRSSEKNLKPDDFTSFEPLSAAQFLPFDEVVKAFAASQ